MPPLPPDPRGSFAPPGRVTPPAVPDAPPLPRPGPAPPLLLVEPPLVRGLPFDPAGVMSPTQPASRARPRPPIVAFRQTVRGLMPLRVGCDPARPTHRDTSPTAPYCLSGHRIVRNSSRFLLTGFSGGFGTCPDERPGWGAQTGEPLKIMRFRFVNLVLPLISAAVAA